MRIFLMTLAAIAALSACSTSRNDSASTTVSAASATASAPTPSPTPRPSATPIAPAPTALPSASTGPSSAPSESPAPVAPALAPDAPPQLVNVKMNKTVVAGGDTISGSVTTSSNVASVEARVATYSIAVPKTGVGTFALTYVVPNVPFFLHRTYTMTIIARNARGDMATTDVPLTIH